VPSFNHSLDNSNNSESLLLRQVQLPDGAIYDIRIEGGLISALTRAGVDDPQILRGVGKKVAWENGSINANGNLLLPGLHDHHLHLFAAAADRASIQCGPPKVANEESLRQLLVAEYASGEGWIRGAGFHESVVPAINRHWLDRVCPDRPVRIQHRSGMLWILNSCAIDALNLSAESALPDGVEHDIDGSVNGRFYNLDGWLRERLPSAWPCLKGISRELASYGITGVTDTGANNGEAVWSELALARESGHLKQRLQVMGCETLDALWADHYDPSGAMFVGPLKIYLREADLPPLEGLVRRIKSAHKKGRAVAFHCVTRVEMHFLLAALGEAGVIAGDRIEHASVADDYAIQRIAELGVTIVTQPHFIAQRGDQYLEDVDREDIQLLYRTKSFVDSGLKLAAGSDAPYGSLDPWFAMNAAIRRKTHAGVLMEEEECLKPGQALALYAGELSDPGSGVRELAVGQRADLCLLDVPFEKLLDDLSASHVAVTICEGGVIYESI